MENLADDSEAAPMKWEPPGEDGPRRVRDLGLRPPIKRFGEIRVVGYYDVPVFEEEVYIAEVIVRQPWWMIDLEEWHPYQPRAWNDEHGVGMADFYLSEDGEELIGSYLAAPPIHQTTRFALVLTGGADLPNRVGDQRLKIPDSTPIPERLLRLIWLDL